MYSKLSLNSAIYPIYQTILIVIGESSVGSAVQINAKRTKESGRIVLTAIDGTVRTLAAKCISYSKVSKVCLCLGLYTVILNYLTWQLQCSRASQWTDWNRWKNQKKGLSKCIENVPIKWTVAKLMCVKHVKLSVYGSKVTTLVPCQGVKHYSRSNTYISTFIWQYISLGVFPSLRCKCLLHGKNHTKKSEPKIASHCSNERSHNVNVHS